MNITVAKARQLLAHADPNAVLVIPGFSPSTYRPVTSLAITNMAYNEQTGRVGFARITPILERAQYTQKDVVEGVAAVALY